MKGKGKGKKHRPKVDKSLEPTGKRPRIAEQVAQEENHPTWRFKYIDRENWTWDKVLWDELIPVLQDLEAKTWDQIHRLTREKEKHSFVPIENLPQSTVQQLERRQLDDVPQLFSIRVRGGIRAWGFQIDKICFLLWWDPKKTVYPTSRRHT